MTAVNLRSTWLERDGVRLHVTEAGEGPAVLLMHGYPDTHQVWHKQIPALVAAGYRAIAPDLRGFGASDKPAHIDEYLIPETVADMAQVLDSLGVSEPTALISHDWGSVASWALIDAMPERFSCFAPMSAGPPQTFVNCTDLRQRELSWYILFFQMQGVAEESLMADDWRLYRDLFRSHPDLEEVIEQMSKPGALTAGLNWYRANFPWLSNAGELQAFAPTMGFWSDGDHFLTEELMIGAGRYVTGCWDYQRLRGASHWLMQDDRVNRLLLNFLASHHPV